MNGKIFRYLLRFGVFALCGLMATATLGTPASSRSAAPQQTTAFLSAPYYGSTRVSSVFDHDYDPDGFNILAFNGDTANRWVCPCRPTGDCADPDFDLGYFNCNLGRYIYYDDHNGVDYVLRYDYVRAAAPGTVARANWANTNHQVGYGLHVRIDHDLNGDHITDYQTIYGHMSVLRVQMGDEIPADADEFARIIGISGNTGWSSGPHLHFEVRNAAGTAVDPYGPDRNPDHKLWIERPSIDPHVIYTSGDRPLTAPPINENEPGAFTVDDGDTGFQATPNCWQTNQAAPGWSGDYLTRTIPGGNCTATWNFAQTRTDGRYHVFVHIPNDNVAPGNRRATVDTARYAITHTVSSSQPWSKQTQVVVVDQWVYPNNAHPSRWVYLGAYYFDTNQYSTDYVRLESDTLDSGAGVMAADAVRFAPVRYRIYLPLVMKRWPPIPDVPVLNSINNPNGGSGYTVSWQAAYLASTYTLQEATNANFTGAVTRYTGAGTSWAAVNKPVGTYYYRVKASNSWGDSGWSNVQQTTVLPPAGWQTIASQNFEGTFPGAWAVWDNNGTSYGEYTWGKRTCRPYAGSYSGWGVGGGAQGAALNCGSHYPHNANGWMVYGPFSLMDAARAELQSKLWLYTEPDNDYMLRGASVDGVHFYGYATSGNTQGWADRSLDLSNVPTLGNLLGRSQVWVALVFASNGSTTYAEGGYVDDVVLRKCYRECPSGSGASTAAGRQAQEVAVMVTRNRGGTLGVPGVEPQPFVSPLSAPEPFRSPLPVPEP